MSPAIATNSKERFSDRVKNYVRYRPDYPAEIVPFLEDRKILYQGAVCADIGSGTGIFTRNLLDADYGVFAVEPNNEMRHAAENYLSGYSNFHSIKASAEATILETGSVDCIFSAQAFHWFSSNECQSEFSRILKQNGHLVLIWNERQTTSTPFLRELENLLQTFCPDYRKIRPGYADESAMKKFFSQGVIHKHVFKNNQSLNWTGLQGRILSASYVPMPDQADHKELMEDLRNLFEKRNISGQVEFLYDCKIYYGKLT